MATKAKRHTHKYYQASAPGVATVWACALSDCNHFMPPHYSHLVMGKASWCWGCEETFVLDPIAMKMEKPMCAECRLTKPIFNAAPDGKPPINPKATAEFTTIREIHEEPNSIKAIEDVLEENKTSLDETQIKFLEDIVRHK